MSTYLLMVHVCHVALTDEGQDGIRLRSFVMESWGILLMIITAGSE